MTRARLQERHQDTLHQKLYKLKQEQGVECEPLLPTIKREPASLSNRPDPEESQGTARAILRARAGHRPRERQRLC
ncbi:hypothetical protein EK904_006991 [Melospiza melodia maxima]|nr:hypothetical protein EK904_006991 [Melospiza melodia maxima]